MSIAITIALSLLLIFIGTIVLQNAEKIWKLLKCKWCPCKSDPLCCKESKCCEEKKCNQWTLTEAKELEYKKPRNVRDNKGRFTKAK